MKLIDSRKAKTVGFLDAIKGRISEIFPVGDVVNLPFPVKPFQQRAVMRLSFFGRLAAFGVEIARFFYHG